jgi:eukaryotic-like serine/threonine-protein kinase
MKLHPGVLIAGSYSLERPLAVGGMGSVWVAWDPSIEGRVAIKFLDAVHADTELGRARFEREATLLSGIKNPHVVSTREFRVEADIPFIVMELLDGEDLGSRLRRVSRISVMEASSLLTQLARGLGAAHDAGIIHRDLKPANVFLAKTEAGDLVKLLDFGLAKSRTATEVGESTKTGELLGSPHFMSPEQIRSPTAIDHRSDLWSVAVILFRALTGELPFKGEQVGPVLARILTDPIPVATVVAPDLAPALDAFFARGLARDPAMRFQSARELSHALAMIAEAAPMPYMVMPALLSRAPVASNQRAEMLPPPVHRLDEGDDATRVMPQGWSSIQEPVAAADTLQDPVPAHAVEPAIDHAPVIETARGAVPLLVDPEDATTQVPNGPLDEVAVAPPPGALGQAGVYPAVAAPDATSAPVAALVPLSPPKPLSRVPWAALAFLGACTLCAAVFVIVGRAAADDAAKSAGASGTVVAAPTPTTSVAPGPAPSPSVRPPVATPTQAAVVDPTPSVVTPVASSTPDLPPPSATSQPVAAPVSTPVSTSRTPRPPVSSSVPGHKKSTWGF